MNSSHQKYTSLFEAILSQDLSKIKELIDLGYNVNQHLWNAEDLTPLIQAINLGRVKFVEILLAAGADVHLSQYAEDTPLGLATSSNNLDIVKLLLKAGANPNWGGAGGDPLERAVEIGSVDLVKTLIEAGADINRPGANSWTPLMAAGADEHIEIVKFLVVLHSQEYLL
jgi:ankyrin repeat protein